MRPAGPLPCTNGSSTPSSRARWRTAGEASGLSPGARRAAGASGGGATARGAAGGGGLGATATAAGGLAAAGVATGAGAVGAASRALPAPSTSRRISSSPTAITWPGAPPRARILPATGEGISTVALSVMTSASNWSSATVSPTCTCHSTSSTSAMPSPMSGILMT
ncbi:hypothetical protein D9M69_582900 [compost metagenome]